MLLMPAKPKEDVYVTVCSEKKKKKGASHVYLCHGHIKGLRTHPISRRTGKALHLALFGLLVVNGILNQNNRDKRGSRRNLVFIVLYSVYQSSLHINKQVIK